MEKIKIIFKEVNIIDELLNPSPDLPSTDDDTENDDDDDLKEKE